MRANSTQGSTSRRWHHGLVPDPLELPAISAPCIEALLRGLMANPSAPVPVLLRLAKADVDRSKLAARRDLPPAVAAVVADDHDAMVRLELASNPNLPPEVQARLAVDTDERGWYSVVAEAPSAAAGQQP